MNWMQEAVARRHTEEGLTLIELMIVILILGILSAIIVLGIGAFQNTGDSQTCIASAKSIEAAAAAYYAKTNGASTPAYGTISSLQTAGYLKNTPKASWNLPNPDSSGTVATTSCPT